MISLAALLVLQTPAIAPSLPPRCTQRLYDTSFAVQQALSDGRFQDAQAALDKWPTGSIGYDVEGQIPAGAEAEAADLWKSASEGRVTFARSSQPLVLFKVTESVAAASPPEWREGKLYAEIPASYVSAGQASGRLVAHAMAKAFGHALGLAPTLLRQHVMGPITLQGFGTVSINITERAQLKEIIDVRDTLAKATKDKRKLTPAHPEVKIERKDIDAGYVSQGKTIPLEFKLTNSGNVPARLQIETTCGCIILDKLESIAPGETAILRPQVDTRDLLGPIEKHISVLSNDPKHSEQTLTINLISLPEYRILPDTAPIFTLDDEGATTKELIVYSVSETPFEVISAQLARPDVIANIVPFEGDVIDPLFGEKAIKRKGARIVLRFAPEFPTGNEYVRIVVVTNAPKRPYQDVAILTQKGIVAQPKGASFGIMNIGQKDTRTITLEHISKPFEITGIETEGDSITARLEKDGDSGKKYKIIISAHAQKEGFITGKVTVKTTSKSNPVIVIPISGMAK